MPCGCTEGACSCFINDSNTVSVSGSGASGSPYFLSVIADGDLGLTSGIDGVGILLDPDPCNLATLSGAGLLVQLHTSNAGNVTFTGCGTAGDPLVGTVSVGPGTGIANFEAGMMMVWPTPDAAPLGWLKVDTGVYDGDDPTYAALYARLGKLWGDQGAGGNFFCLPPTPGRSMIGAGTGSGEDAVGGPNAYPSGVALATRVLGEWFGSQDVVLGTTNLPSHSHTSPAHVHDYSHAHGGTSFEFINPAWNETPVEDYGNPGGDNTSPIITGGRYQVVAGRTIASGGTGLGNVEIQGSDHQHSTPAIGPINTGAAVGDATTGATGSGLPHANVHPSLVVDWIICLG